MKSDEEISTANSAQIESLNERVKQGKLEQNDAQLIERLLRAFGRTSPAESTVILIRNL
jgi:hypothetical protein